MTEYRDPEIDGDLKKGAVESADDWSASASDEEGQPLQAIAVTEDVLNADAREIAEAEYVLGADEEGTPG